MRVVLFGTGDYYERYKIWFINVNVVAVLDNDCQKHGKIIDGTKILPPADVLKIDFHRIYILNFAHSSEILLQLLDLGVERSKIFSYDEIYDTLFEFLPTYTPNMFIPNLNFNSFLSGKKKIVCFSFELDLNGAVIALQQAVTVFKNNGYSVIVVSARDGTMRKTFVEMNVSVVISPDIYVKALDDLNWLVQFDLIFVNTHRFYYLFRRYHGKALVIWWLHEPDSFYDNGSHILSNLLCDNVTTVAVSSLAKKAFSNKCPKWEVEILRVGLRDFYNFSENTSTNSKIIFAVIGAITHNKGQHILLDAIQMLSQEEISKCEFWIIGSAQSSFGINVIRRAQKMCNVFVFENMDIKILHKKIYPKISILICPSFEETMSLTAIESMMHQKAVLVSNGTGIADFIESKWNGCVFKAGNAKSLFFQIQWIINNRCCLSEMGRNARSTYERSFSLDAFETSLLSLIR